MAADTPQQTPIPLPTYGQRQPTVTPPAIAPTPAAQSAETADGVSIAPTTETSMKDVVMTDANGPDQALSPAPVAPSTNAPSPAPARTGTPLRNGPESTSRAASQHPDPAFTMPDAAPAHGAPSRQYLNSKVVPHLLEGMKQLAQDKPKDPLRVLGEFLLERSKEHELEK
ncbi:hypothetical protein F5Y16DRAFT_365462 [Xylariaceae sp. FL0255]|nr:hypothetical protein F5Y16DRAFT_365462 [Xylariaceae sp. FL0255]